MVEREFIALNPTLLDADTNLMGLIELASCATSRQEETWSDTRAETPRRFHIRRLVGLAILAVVAMFLPLGPNRPWLSATLMIAGIIVHGIQKRLPVRNVDGATQWIFLGTAFICSALVPATLPSAAIAVAADVAGGSRQFSRKLNYLWIAVGALGILIIGVTSSPTHWQVVLAAFVATIPGSVELGAWHTERSEIERRRMRLMSNLGQALTWEAELETRKLMWIDGPVEELLGVDHEHALHLVNVRKAISPLDSYPGENREWIAEIPNADGTPRWLRTNGQLRTRADGAMILSGVSVDITEIELARRHQEQRAEHDSLTGLSNREGLAKFLNEESHRIGRAILVADIDRFKDINDTLGHLVGDSLIAAAAARINRLSSSNRLVARLGGDEFAIALVGDSEEAVGEEAEALAIELSNILADGFAVQDIELHITASIGIAAGTELDWTELLRRGDQAMYDAKRTGGGHKWYDRVADGSAVEQMRLESSLTKSLEDEIVLHYQPVVSAETHQIVGVECLARWNNPERGMVFPDTFLPIIENAGMTARFDRHVLHTAVAAASEMAASGRTITVSVNLSPRSLWSPKLLVELRELLAEHPLARERLVIEVTEQGLQNDFSRSLPLFESLRKMGVRLSLDDFGTGGSSLIRLRSLPFDEIKIDRSFVDGVPGEGIDATIVKSTIELANALGMSTVAEGVESLDQASAIAEMGCRKLQGWAFAKAMPLDELFETWINAPESVGVES